MIGHPGDGKDLKWIQLNVLRILLQTEHTDDRREASVPGILEVGHVGPGLSPMHEPPCVL